MSVYRDWEFYAKNNDGTFLSSKQIECLIAFDEHDLRGMEWYSYDSVIGNGCTNSSFSYDRIRDAVECFGLLYPEVNMTVLVDCNGEKGGFMLRGGKVQDFSSCIVYLDSEGRELDPLNGF